MEQKRQRLDEDNSTTYNTVELYRDNEYHATQDAPMPTIEENTPEEPIVVDPTAIRTEEEFIPIGARGKVHWTFAITAASTDEEINAQGPGSLMNAVIQVENDKYKNSGRGEPPRPKRACQKSKRFTGQEG